MELINPGAKCVIDFTELSLSLMNELRFIDPKLGKTNAERSKLQGKLDALICAICDDYINTQLYWTKCALHYTSGADMRLGQHLDVIHAIIPKYPSPTLILDTLEDKIAEYVSDVINLPTWNIVYVRYHRAMAQIELGEDYRIKEWMKVNAADYGVSEVKYDW